MESLLSGLGAAERAPLVVGYLLPGHMELVIIAFVALLLFGHRLPGLMRSLGTGITEFKRGMNAPDDEPEDKDKDGESDGEKKPKK